MFICLKPLLEVQIITLLWKPPGEAEKLQQRRYLEKGKKKKKIYRSLQPLQKKKFSVLTELSWTWNLRLDISPQAKAYIYRTCTIIRLYLKCEDSVQSYFHFLNDPYNIQEL